MALETVTVACKLPHGLHLDLQRPGKPKERVTIHGFTHPGAIAGFGITENVNKEFFDEWLRQNKDLEPVKQGLIFSHAQQKSVIDQAKDKAYLKSGLEALDPNKPSPGIEPMTA